MTDFQIFEWVFLIFLISFFIYLNRGMVGDGGYFFADDIQMPLVDGGMDFTNLHNRILCEFAKLKAFLKEKKRANTFGGFYQKLSLHMGFCIFKFAHEKIPFIRNDSILFPYMSKVLVLERLGREKQSSGSRHENMLFHNACSNDT